MARLYTIAVTGPAGTNPILAQTFSSVPGGKYDPGALNVQLDLVSTVAAVPAGNCTITIDGIPLSLLQQPANFRGLNVTVSGGMFAPPGNQFQLIVPKQAGILLTGQIFQSFGNWVGNEMNLNFVVVASGYTFARPGNFVFQWQQGQSLVQAITNTLNTAYGNPKIINQVGGSYAPQGTTSIPAGKYGTLQDFAQFIKKLTASANSNGVDIAAQVNGSFLLFDNLASNVGTVTLNFTDLIGQPRWVDVETVQFQTVMRADIQVGTKVMFPAGIQSIPGIVTQSAAALPGVLKYKTSFQGGVIVNAVRHIGNFRDADGTSWSSIFQAVPTTAAA